MVKKMVNKYDNQSDHDLLIKLVETSKNNHDNVLNKLDDLRLDMVEIKDGTTTRLSDHEARIYAIERWVQDFKLTWRVMVGIAATVGALIGFVLSTVGGFVNLFGRGR